MWWYYDYHFTVGWTLPHKVKGIWLHRPSSWFLSHSEALSFPEMKLMTSWKERRQERSSNCESHTWAVLQAALSWKECALPRLWEAVHCKAPCSILVTLLSPETSTTVSSCASRAVKKGTGEAEDCREDTWSWPLASTCANVYIPQTFKRAGQIATAASSQWFCVGSKYRDIESCFP